LPATQAAVFNALELERHMKDLGPASPCLFLTAPQEDYPKIRIKISGYRKCLLLIVYNNPVVLLPDASPFLTTTVRTRRTSSVRIGLDPPPFCL